MSTMGLVAVIMAGSMSMTQGQVKARQKKNCICVEQEQISLLVIDALTNAVHTSLASIGVPLAIINMVQRGFRVCKRMGMGPMQTLYHFIQRSDASRYLRRVLEPKAHKDNCVHIHIYLYKHTHTYISLYIPYSYVSICCMHVYTPIFISILHIYLYAYRFLYLYLYFYTWVYVYICSHMYMCIILQEHFLYTTIVSSYLQESTDMLQRKFFLNHRKYSLSFPFTRRTKRNWIKMV